MAALVLMATTFVPFSKVLAQGLVEYAIILVVVPFNKNTESVELIYLPNPPSQAKPQHLLPDDEFVFRFFVTPIAETGGDPTCTQTIQVPVEITPGLNVMTVATSNNHLAVNGQPVGDELDPTCFGDVDRLYIAVGRPGPPGSDPTVLPAGFQRPEFLVGSVVGPNAETRAVFVGGLFLGDYMGLEE